MLAQTFAESVPSAPGRPPAASMAGTRRVERQGQRAFLANKAGPIDARTTPGWILSITTHPGPCLSIDLFSIDRCSHRSSGGLDLHGHPVHKRLPGTAQPEGPRVPFAPPGSWLRRLPPTTGASTSAWLAEQRRVSLEPDRLGPQCKPVGPAYGAASGVTSWWPM